MFQSDLEGLSQGVQLFIGLNRNPDRWVHGEFTIVGTKLDIGELDIEGISIGLNVKNTGNVVDRSVANVIRASGRYRCTVTVHVFFTGLEQGSSSVSFHHSGAS